MAKTVNVFDLTTDKGFEKFMARFGAKYLSSGAQRSVYQIPGLPFVVKEDDKTPANHKCKCNPEASKYCAGHNYRLNGGNIKEAAAYRKIVAAGLEENVAKVYAVSKSGRYLLMERVDTSKQHTLRSRWPLTNKTMAKLQRKFIAMFQPLGIGDDFHAANIGQRKGQWVVLDMGIAN